MNQIHVFDLDDTIVGNYVDTPTETTELLFNKKIVNKLRELVKKRDAGQVRAIFLLTNNSNQKFIHFVVNRLNKEIGVTRVFDSIQSRYSIGRNGPMHDPTKSLADVRVLLKKAGLPLVFKPSDVYFYDDRADHEIGREIPKKNYTLVKEFTVNRNKTLRQRKQRRKTSKQRI